MKVVIAIDSLKGSLSSIEAGEAIREGILRAKPDADVVIKPLADGGEGTTDALIEGLKGERVPLTVTGPFGRPVDCYYGYLKESRTAVMEMASAAGITLEPIRDPMRATTRGVGEMILHAIENGCRNFIIGIGGSATNDGGIGMLEALGYEFWDQNGDDVGDGGQALAKVSSFSDKNADPRLKECRFRVACDVTNPLCGPMGATYIYGPQKGVTKDLLESLDRGMANFARVVTASVKIERNGILSPDMDITVENSSQMNAVSDFTELPYTGKETSFMKIPARMEEPNFAERPDMTEEPDFAQMPGAGAAGGLGFALLRFLNADLTPGVELILSATGLEKEVADADVVVTGEGRLDHQTAMGKAPIGVAKLGKQYGAKVIAFAGSIAPGAEACNAAGIDAFFPILRSVCTLEEAMNPQTAKENMARTAEQVFRLLPD
ncbi:MAG: glycerate kinase [Lachnospiraceae bacterium]|nr:glycerate kinase [Lachnospiraceae bacterium]